MLIVQGGGKGQKLGTKAEGKEKGELCTWLLRMQQHPLVNEEVKKKKQEERDFYKQTLKGRLNFPTLLIYFEGRRRK